MFRTHPVNNYFNETTIITNHYILYIYYIINNDE